MKKYFLYYSLGVIASVVLINSFWALQLYGSDGYYFWGLSKFMASGKFENLNVFWNLYPSGFPLILAGVIKLIPSISYEQIGLGLLIAYLIIGPLIFMKAYDKFRENSFSKGLFFFYFATSGFYVVEYLVGEIILPQAFAYLLLPLFPFLIFSQKNKFYLICLLLTLYFLHSPTLLFILMSTTLCVFNKKTRGQTLWITVLLTPFLLLKILHLLLLKFGYTYNELPLNTFLSEYSLASNTRIFTEKFKSLPLYQLMLSGVPFFIWILFLKNKALEFVWYRNLALVATFAIIFFQTWSELLPFAWPKERYLGFLWLPIGLSFPYIFANKVKFKKGLIVLATMFIVFQYGMAFYRETRINEGIDKQINWLESLKKHEPENIVVLYKGNGGTYSYGIFAPANIYQVFPTKESKSSTVNARTELPGYYKDILPESIEDNLIDAQIDLIVIDKSFVEILKVLNSGKTYKLLSSFNDEAYAYILAE